MSLVPVKADNVGLVVSGGEWAAMREQCNMLVKSGFLPAAIKTPEAALAIALKGHEIGVPMMQAFGQINVIQGKPAVSAELQLALIYRNVPGAKVEFERLESDGCTIIATRPGHRPVKISFNRADAEAAQLTSKDTWKKFPRAMYRSRAISEMARSIFPDAIMGCSYTPEEMGAVVNEEGEILDVTPPQTAPTKKREDVFHEKAIAAVESKEAKPKSKGYDGGTDHQKILKETLKAKNVDESLWEEIHSAMMGKGFNELDAVMKQVFSP